MIVFRLLWVVVAATLGVALLPAASALAAETITIRTMPPTSGIALTVNGRRVVTNAAGRASAVVNDAANVDIWQPTKHAEVDVGVRAKVGDVDARGGSWTVRLNLEYLVNLTFATRDGERIDNGTIERIVLRSSTGTVKRFKPTEAVWLQGLRVARLGGGLTPKDIWWNIDDVRVRGSTVVNRSQQRFEPANMPVGDRTVDVELLYFDASVRVRDAFFGSPVGGELIVEHPDGSVGRHVLDADGSVDLGDVPRGQYQMAVAGRGLRIPRPMTITRDVDDELRFYSWLDVGLAAMFIALFLWGFLAVGAARRRSQSTALPDPAEDDSGYEQPDA